MSTRCRVAYQYDGIYMSANVHYDGYVDGVGEKLVTFYSDFDDAAELVMGGDMRFVTNNPDANEHYDMEGFPNVMVHDCFDDLIEYFERSDEEYLYVISEKDEIWRVYIKRTKWDDDTDECETTIEYPGFVEDLLGENL